MLPVSTIISKPVCTACKKKLGLLGHSCKCEKSFCTAHLHDHICTYDYKANGKRELEAQLLIGPLSSKVDPI
jgi:hypothetical protein